MSRSKRPAWEDSTGVGSRDSSPEAADAFHVDRGPASKRQVTIDPRSNVRTDGDEEAAHVQLVADHYSARENQTRTQREHSPIIHLKKLNNWVKSVLLRMYTKPKDYVLDLACGKGGDLAKWEKADIAFYAGVDVASGSVEDARKRYNGEAETSKHRRKNKPMNFPARFLCADCFGVSIEDSLQDLAPFDIISCQFALHYCFETKERARQALRNISALLRPGGVFIGTLPDANTIVQKLRASDELMFGNEVYSIRFDSRHESKLFPSSRPYGIKYDFHLQDAVDCPEWLVPFPSLQSLAEEFGLELDMKANFHTFIHKHSADPNSAELMGKIVGANWYQEIREDEWDAAYLYMTFAFKKKGPDRSIKNRTKTEPSLVSPDDIVYIGS